MYCHIVFAIKIWSNENENRDENLLTIYNYADKKTIFVDKSGKVLFTESSNNERLYKIFDIETDKVKYVVKEKLKKTDEIYRAGEFSFYDRNAKLYDLNGKYIMDLLKINSSSSFYYGICYKDYIFAFSLGYVGDKYSNDFLNTHKTRIYIKRISKNNSNHNNENMLMTLIEELDDAYYGMELEIINNNFYFIFTGNNHNYIIQVDGMYNVRKIDLSEKILKYSDFGGDDVKIIYNEIKNKNGNIYALDYEKITREIDIRYANARSNLYDKNKFDYKEGYYYLKKIFSNNKYDKVFYNSYSKDSIIKHIGIYYDKDKNKEINDFIDDNNKILAKAIKENYGNVLCTFLGTDGIYINYWNDKNDYMFDRYFVLDKNDNEQKYYDEINNVQFLSICGYELPKNVKGYATYKGKNYYYVYDNNNYSILDSKGNYLENNIPILYDDIIAHAVVDFSENGYDQAIKFTNNEKKRNFY